MRDIPHSYVLMEHLNQEVSGSQGNTAASDLYHVEAVCSSIATMPSICGL